MYIILFCLVVILGFGDSTPNTRVANLEDNISMQGVRNSTVARHCFPQA